MRLAATLARCGMAITGFVQPTSAAAPAAAPSMDLVAKSRHSWPCDGPGSDAGPGSPGGGGPGQRCAVPYCRFCLTQTIKTEMTVEASSKSNREPWMRRVVRDLPRVTE